MDFLGSLGDTCKQPCDFGVDIQRVVSTHYHKHMDLRTEHFRNLCHLDNRYYFGNLQHYICRMDFLDNHLGIYIQACYQQDSIQHLDHKDR
jgi:hypothetical protein